MWQNKELYLSSCYIIFHSSILIVSDLRKEKLKAGTIEKGKEIAGNTLGLKCLQRCEDCHYFLISWEVKNKRCGHAARGWRLVWWISIIRAEWCCLSESLIKEPGKTVKFLPSPSSVSHVRCDNRPQCHKVLFLFTSYFLLPSSPEKLLALYIQKFPAVGLGGRAV